MTIALLLGVFSGIVAAFSFLGINFLFNTPQVASILGVNWYFFPPAFGLITALLYTIAGYFPKSSMRSFSPRQGLVDVFESYFFGVFRVRSVQWFIRGLLSLMNALIGGIFGIEGATLEFSFAVLPLFYKKMRLSIADRQLFVVCIISASLGVALGTPFTGALIALELAYVREAKIRTMSVISAFAAFGTASLIQLFLFPGFDIAQTVGRNNLLSSLFRGMKSSVQLQQHDWFSLLVAAVGIGIGSGVLVLGLNKFMVYSEKVFDEFFKNRFRLKIIATGVLMGLAVYLVPESFGEPAQLWEDIAWGRLSFVLAFLLVVAKIVLLVIALSGWGSTGLFSPLLLIGALFGAGVGGFLSEDWAVPLAVAGSVSVLSGSFLIPLSTSVLVLEIGGDVPSWLFATAAIACSTAFIKLFHYKPLHERFLERLGHRIVGGRLANLFAQVKANEVMTEDFQEILENANLDQLRAAIVRSKHNFLAVVKEDGKFVGLLSIEQLPVRIKKSLIPHSSGDRIRADLQAAERVLDIRELVDRQALTVVPSDSLERALHMFEESYCLAVVDENQKIRGLLFEYAVLGRYNREITRSAIMMT